MRLNFLILVLILIPLFVSAFDYRFDANVQCINVELSDDYPKNLVSLNGKYDGYLGIKLYIDNNNIPVKSSITKGKTYDRYADLFNTNLWYISANNTIYFSEKLAIEIIRKELGTINGKYFFVLCAQTDIPTSVFGDLKYDYSLFNTETLWIRYRTLFIFLIVFGIVVLLAVLLMYLDAKHDIFSPGCRSCCSDTATCICCCARYMRF